MVLSCLLVVRDREQLPASLSSEGDVSHTVLAEFNKFDTHPAELMSSTSHLTLQFV